MSRNIASILDERIAAELPDLIRLRHELHAHPQVGFEEEYAADAIRRELQAAGVPFLGGVSGTGVVAWLVPEGRSAESAVALRADMDALPVEEETGLPYASTIPGRMHACGHDGHMAILIGTARVLSRLKDELPRPVKFFFQPAEETARGAETMVEAGAMDARTGGVKVGAVYGLHGWPGLPLGSIGTRVGPLMAAADIFRIVVRGKGGHGSAPHDTRDPIVASTQIVSAVQTIVSRNVDPRHPVVITVASIHAGEADNVIPDAATMTGTIRSLDEATAESVHRRLTEVAESTARAFGCSAVVGIRNACPVTCNHRAATELVLQSAREVLGLDGAVLLADPVMASEDFSVYGRSVPACFFFLGTGPRGEKAAARLHTPGFDFNDDAIRLGIGILCRLALQPPPQE